ncbi:MAG TPA: glucoamylase family protein [Bryobacteraceae bacterium]|nr:glucoamylase family protein [Bryobacteraceae bacterium]
MPESSIQTQSRLAASLNPAPTANLVPEPELNQEELDLNEREQLELRDQAIRVVQTHPWLRGKRCSSKPREIHRRSSMLLNKLEQGLYKLKTDELTEDLKWLRDNIRLVRTDIQELNDATKILTKLPPVRSESDEPVPRVIVFSRTLLLATKNRLSVPIVRFFMQLLQQVEPLQLAELSGMLSALKLVLFERLAERGHQALDLFKAEGSSAPPLDIGRLIISLRFIGELDWKEILEQLSAIHYILRLDPCGVYPRMEFDSRNTYRKALAKIAAHARLSEVDVAKLAVEMAQKAEVDSTVPNALRERVRHVGYYLLDEVGSQELMDRAGYRPPFTTRFQNVFLKFPDEVYIIGIEFVTLITVVALLMSIVRTHEAAGLIAGALLLILPATQAAVELMNYLVTAVLPPRALPKLDFSAAVDSDCATMVAIPTLLINEKQIRQLVDELEVRYLVNRDPNIYFSLLTDLPDTAEPPEKDDPRIDLAIRLIDNLNAKYRDEPYGGFFLFHRHRVFNPREGAWMGWERKRGKLLDLNQLLRKTFDPFPVKTGDLSRLPHIRYVLTLDSDTQLPRGSAQRMIGAMAHPLNGPLIDPERNIVTKGYGILQPRVGISVQSASRSRLANIYSGRTGFDIYSRAVSDVYQDLYGEGIFTGKGIYDIDALRQVLEHRFPRDALLSHDLIEGAYARAGLVSDIEVIDDYPSHYSAYNRRKHRWLRGDWQIVRWIFNRVPDESWRLVQNPISLVSRWKIVDNLRRSLIEPATFWLLVAGWFSLVGPRFWTLVTIALLFLPIYFRLLLKLISTSVQKEWMAARDSFTDFFTSHASTLLNIAFLAHQMLVAFDAIARAIVRSTITHSRLLEWETATEAELGFRKRTAVDVYLDWIPLLAIPLGVLLYFKRPEALRYALPFIVLWCGSKLLSNWLNRSPHTETQELSPVERLFLRETALRTWRYFAEFSNEKNNWLVPDYVQEQPPRIAEKISPTNLGFLLNARQAAGEFGYLTVMEFLSLTELTLASASKFQSYFGHYVNWYDNMTLKPIEPPAQFVSSVDSGNLAASLWTLKQGCLELLTLPLTRLNPRDGFADIYRIAGRKTGKDSNPISRILTIKNPDMWLSRLLSMPANAFTPSEQSGSPESWWTKEIKNRIRALHQQAHDFTPWHLPEYESILSLPKLQFELPAKPLTPQTGASYYQELDTRLQALHSTAGVPQAVLNDASRLREELPACRERLNSLAARIRSLANEANRRAREMDFRPLVDPVRKLLTIGYHVDKQELAKSCYDLLASEARIATFIAVAKGETVPDNWFRLGRQHTLCEGENVLISWTGTMFEYLMAVIWMKSHPQTLLDRATRSVVRAQIAYAKRHRIPWGISESAFAKTAPEGDYQYAAFGVSGLALNQERAGLLVLSPYSTCLALLVDAPTAVENLRAMARRKWLGDYGFYESADFSIAPPRRLLPRKYGLCREWMAHHQGMSLASLCNVLHGHAFQRWFHAEPLVQANALILQERPLRVRPINDTLPLYFGEQKRRTTKVKAAKKVAASA